MSGRTAKRLRTWLYELRHTLGATVLRQHSATKRQLARAWAGLSGRQRGRVISFSRSWSTQASRLFDHVPVPGTATPMESGGKKGGTGLLRARLRVGGPAKHPRRWAHERREQRRRARRAGGGR